MIRMKKMADRMSATTVVTAVVLLALAVGTAVAGNSAGSSKVEKIGSFKVSKKPRAGALVPLTSKGKFPAATIPKNISVRNADRVGGWNADEVIDKCPPEAADVGSFCMLASTVTIPAADVGKNNFVWASSYCGQKGGWLPSAAQLIASAGRVKLKSTSNDNELTASIDVTKNQREMSSTLIATDLGNVGAYATPVPGGLSYLTVFDNDNNGGLAGAKAVTATENFRCAFGKYNGFEIKE